jgi:hypothetical protein
MPPTIAKCSIGEAEKYLITQAIITTCNTLS